jgi:hypothetical protein
MCLLSARIAERSMVERYMVVKVFPCKGRLLDRAQKWANVCLLRGLCLLAHHIWRSFGILIGLWVFFIFLTSLGLELRNSQSGSCKGRLLDRAQKWANVCLLRGLCLLAFFLSTSFLGYSPHHIWRSFGILIGLWVFFIFLTSLGLELRNSQPSSFPRVFSLPRL